jgi:hypothetical protein
MIAVARRQALMYVEMLIWGARGRRRMRRRLRKMCM